MMEAYLERFESVRNAEEKHSLVEWAKAMENTDRELFAKGKQVKGGLLPVFDSSSGKALFTMRKWFCEEEDLPRLFDLGKAERERRRQGPITVKTVDEFEEQFLTVFGCDALRFLDWNNMVAAGGSVLGCLTPIPQEHCGSLWQKRRYYSETALPESDIDLFLYGLDPEQANEKLLEIYDALCRGCQSDVLCVRTSHTVTMVSQYPVRHVQVILRLYSCPYEVIAGFDLDCCAFLYDGKGVYTTPRGHYALTTGGNSIDLSRRSLTYEYRLAKYAQRGFEVILPSLDRSRVRGDMLNVPVADAQGLARLMILEQRWSTGTLMKERKKTRQKEVNFVDGIENELDYTALSLPWKPGTTVSGTISILKMIDQEINSSKWKDSPPIRVHVFFFGTAEEILQDCAPGDSILPPDHPLTTYEYFVRGELAWLQDNPGRQQIGSFHPISDSTSWVGDLYAPPWWNDVLNAISWDDADALRALMGRNGRENLDFRDSHGRDLLEIALLSGSTRCFKSLIEEGKGVDVVSKKKGGQTVLHLVAVHNRHQVMPCLYKALAQTFGEDLESFNAFVGQKAKYGDTELSALQVAAILGRTTVCKFLLEKFAAPVTTVRSTPFLALLSPHAEGLDELVSLIARHSCKEPSDWFVFSSSHRGTNLDEGILHTVANAGNVPLLKSLLLWLKNHEDQDLFKCLLSALNERGLTPLFSVLNSEVKPSLKLECAKLLYDSFAHTELNCEIQEAFNAQLVSFKLEPPRKSSTRIGSTLLSTAIWHFSPNEYWIDPKSILKKIADIDKAFAGGTELEEQAELVERGHISELLDWVVGVCMASSPQEFETMVNDNTKRISREWMNYFGGPGIGALNKIRVSGQPLGELSDANTMKSSYGMYMLQSMIDFFSSPRNLGEELSPPRLAHARAIQKLLSSLRESEAEAKRKSPKKRVSFQWLRRSKSRADRPDNNGIDTKYDEFLSGGILPLPVEEVQQRRREFLQKHCYEEGLDFEKEVLMTFQDTSGKYVDATTLKAFEAAFDGDLETVIEHVTASSRGPSLLLVRNIPGVRLGSLLISRTKGKKERMVAVERVRDILVDIDGGMDRLFRSSVFLDDATLTTFPAFAVLDDDPDLFELLLAVPIENMQYYVPNPMLSSCLSLDRVECLRRLLGTKLYHELPWGKIASALELQKVLRCQEQHISKYQGCGCLENVLNVAGSGGALTGTVKSLPSTILELACRYGAMDVIDWLMEDTDQVSQAVQSFLDSNNKLKAFAEAGLRQLRAGKSFLPERLNDVVHSPADFLVAVAIRTGRGSAYELSPGGRSLMFYAVQSAQNVLVERWVEQATTLQERTSLLDRPCLVELRRIPSTSSKESSKVTTFKPEYSSPLHIAASRLDVAMIRRLVELGADPFVSTSFNKHSFLHVFGDTLVDFAAAHGRQKVHGTPANWIRYLFAVLQGVMDVATFKELLNQKDQSGRLFFHTVIGVLPGPDVKAIFSPFLSLDWEYIRKGEVSVFALVLHEPDVVQVLLELFIFPDSKEPRWGSLFRENNEGQTVVDLIREKVLSLLPTPTRKNQLLQHPVFALLDNLTPQPRYAAQQPTPKPLPPTNHSHNKLTVAETDGNNRLQHGVSRFNWVFHSLRTLPL